MATRKAKPHTQRAREDREVSYFQRGRIVQARLMLEELANSIEYLSPKVAQEIRCSAYSLNAVHEELERTGKPVQKKAVK